MTRDGLSIACFNARGIKRKQEAIGKILPHTHILGICETWLRESDSGLCERISARVNTKQRQRQQRGFGGVGLVVHPFLKFTKIGGAVFDKFQCITICALGITISVVYLSPVARKRDEEELYEYLNNKHNSTSIIIGDFNARSRAWDTVGNERGNRLTRWAEKNNWKICAPKNRTCVTSQGSSNPDLCICKGTNVNNIHVIPGDWSKWSDHRPFNVHVATNFQKKTKKLGKIKSRLRTHTWYQRKACAWYQTTLKEYEQKFSNCATSGELETVYDDFKRTVLHPWEDARSPVPGRFKSFWTRTLDRLSKKRSYYYKKF